MYMYTCVQSKILTMAKRKQFTCPSIDEWIGVPVVAQWLTNPTRTMRLRVRSLALLSGLTIRRCYELWCRSQRRLGSRVAVALVQASSYSSDSTLSLGTSICRRGGPRNGKKIKKNKTKQKNPPLKTIGGLLSTSCPSSLLGACK